MTRIRLRLGADNIMQPFCESAEKIARRPQNPHGSSRQQRSLTAKALITHPFAFEPLIASRYEFDC